MVHVYDRKASSAILNLVSKVGINKTIISLMEQGEIIPDDIILELVRESDLDIREVCKYQLPPKHILYHHSDLLDWAAVSVKIGNLISNKMHTLDYYEFITRHIKNGNLDPETILYNIKNVNIDLIDFRLIEIVLRKYLSTTINVDKVLLEGKISDLNFIPSWFIVEFEDKLDFFTLSSAIVVDNIPMDLIYKHFNELNLGNIMLRRLFDDEEMTRLLELDTDRLISWFTISSVQYNLSEDFIEKYKNKFDWRLLSAGYKFSLDFLKRHVSDIYITYILKNKNIDNATKTEFEIYYNEHKQVSSENPVGENSEI